MNELNNKIAELRKSFGVNVMILAKYHPIEEVGLRAFDNNETAIQALIEQEADKAYKKGLKDGRDNS